MEIQIKVLQLGYLSFLNNSQGADMTMNEFQLIDDGAILIIPEMIKNGLICVIEFNDTLGDSFLGITEKGHQFLADGGSSDE